MSGTVEIFGLLVGLPIVVQGAVTGMAYGLLAVGLVLVYRSNQVINFAHGEIGAFGAAVFGVAVVQWGVPYWVALPFALAVSASIAALAEIAVVRRLRSAPKLMSLVATLGVAQLLLFLSLMINQGLASGDNFPQPVGLPTFHVGSYLLTQAYVGLLVLSPMVVLGLVLFLRRSRFGLAIRAAAMNADAARMAGVFATRMSTLAWGIAGAVAGLTAILLKPTLGFVVAESLGPTLLLPALAAAVIARMDNLPMALGGGVAIGVVQQVIAQSYPTSGITEVVLFVAILVALLLQTRRKGRIEEKGNWGAVQPFKPLGAALRRSRLVGQLGRIAGFGAVAVFGLLFLVISNQAATTLTFLLATAIVGLSIGIVTGLAGQLSLGQFALAGVGAAVTYQVTARIGDLAFGHVLGFAYAGLAVAVVSVLIGLPALRIRGLLLAVTTLAFAIAAQTFLLQQPWMLGGGVSPGRPTIAGRALDTGRTYYLFAVVVFGLSLLFARNIWRSGLGRRLRALRDNEDGARAFGIPVGRVKLEMFALAGFLAGIGGALYGHGLSFVDSGHFAVGQDINVVAMSVIGGIGILAGPLLGALYILGVPAFVQLSSAGLAASSFGWLILILYFPGGLAQLLRPLRDRLVRAAARFDGVDTTVQADTSLDPDDQPAPLATLSDGRVEPRTASRPVGRVDLLVATGVRKRFGGVQALDEVHLSVRRGETLGLIGPNGAGKTTLFEILGGFTRADTGTIEFDGYDISRLAPEARAGLGLVRSFQDAGLFATLTVLEAVQLAFERNDPTRTVPSLLGSRRADRRKEERARDLAVLMGLESYADTQISELSTGTRRIVELTCVIALEPTLVLLDEPSSGVAQRETEALGELLARVKTHLDTTLVVIEHDIPLIMGMADRIVAMDAGRVIAVGTPQQIAHDDRVLESYLGGGGLAVERSGSLVGSSAPSPVPAGS